MNRSRYAHLYGYKTKQPGGGFDVRTRYQPLVGNEDKYAHFVTKRRLISENLKLAAPRSFNVNCCGKRHTLSIDEFGTLILQHHNIEDAAAESYFGSTLKCFEIWTAWQAFRNRMKSDSAEWIVDKYRKALPRQLHAHARFFADAWNELNRTKARASILGHIGKARKSFRECGEPHEGWTLSLCQRRRQDVLREKFESFYNGASGAVYRDRGRWDQSACRYWSNGVFRNPDDLLLPSLEHWYKRVYLNHGPSLGGNPLILDFKELSKGEGIALCFPVYLRNSTCSSSDGILQWQNCLRTCMSTGARWFFPDLPDMCSLDNSWDGRTRKHKGLVCKKLGGVK